MNPSWLREREDGVILTVHVQPGAKKTEIAGVHGEALKIRLAAPPVEGRANEALIEFLARRLRVKKSQIKLLAGETSRTKRVRIDTSLAPPVFMQLLS